MNNKKINFFSWLNESIKEFLKEAESRACYKIEEIFECKDTGTLKAVIKLSSSQSITKELNKVMSNDALLEGFDKKTIQTLTYIATVEKMMPDYFIVAQKFGDSADDYILEIKSKKDHTIIRKSPSELTRDKGLIAKFSPVEANRIGHLAGISETVSDFELKSK